MGAVLSLLLIGDLDSSMEQPSQKRKMPHFPFLCPCWKPRRLGGRERLRNQTLLPLGVLITRNRTAPDQVTNILLSSVSIPQTGKHA